MDCCVPATNPALMWHCHHTYQHSSKDEERKKYDNGTGRVEEERNGGYFFLPLYLTLGLRLLFIKLRLFLFQIVQHKTSRCR